MVDRGGSWGPPRPAAGSGTDLRELTLLAWREVAIIAIGSEGAVESRGFRYELGAGVSCGCRSASLCSLWGACRARASVSGLGAPVRIPSRRWLRGRPWGRVGSWLWGRPWERVLWRPWRRLDVARPLRRLLSCLRLSIGRTPGRIRWRVLLCFRAPFQVRVRLRSRRASAQRWGWWDEGPGILRVRGAAQAGRGRGRGQLVLCSLGRGSRGWALPASW